MVLANKVPVYEHSGGSGVKEGQDSDGGEGCGGMEGDSEVEGPGGVLGWDINVGCGFRWDFRGFLPF